MTQKFIERIIREGIVDTKSYRYIRKDVTTSKDQWMEIRRIPLDKLDTTDALNDWETVRVIK